MKNIGVNRINYIYLILSGNKFSINSLMFGRFLRVLTPFSLKRTTMSIVFEDLSIIQTFSGPK